MANPVDAQAMRDTLRLWASGVAIVTTEVDGEYAGMTVSAFNSLSLEPPLILVCLNKNTTTAHQVLKSTAFAVSILGEHQAALSDRFAGRVPLVEKADRFQGVPLLKAVTGSPILQEAIAWVDCRIHTIHDGSTHWILIGEVQATGHNGHDVHPLIYFDRDYRNLMVKQPHP